MSDFATRVQEVITGDPSNYAVASGTNTYTATIAPAITAYATGQAFNIKFTNANTGAATINLNTLGAKAIKKNGGSALESGDIQAGQVYTLLYDGTDFEIVGFIGDNGFMLWRNGFANDSAETTAPSYAIVSEVIFGGTDALGTPSKFEALLEMTGATTIDCRVYDVTNAAVICEKLGNSVATATIVDLGALSNLSTGQAVWEIQLKRNGGTGSSRARIHSFQVS